MKLNWTRVDKDRHRYVAETPRFLFTMVAPPRARPGLMVHRADADTSEKPIDQRTCRTRRSAERIAQRFEDAPAARRLR